VLLEDGLVAYDDDKSKRYWTAHFLKPMGIENAAAGFALYVVEVSWYATGQKGSLQKKEM